MFIFKVKRKLLKSKLRVSNQEVFCNIGLGLEEVVEELDFLDYTVVEVGDSQNYELVVDRLKA